MSAVFSIFALLVSYAGMLFWLSRMFPDTAYKIRMGIAGGTAFIVFLLVFLGIES